MPDPIKLPRSLQSVTLGELILDESCIHVGTETFRDCTYQTRVVTCDVGTINLVLNPDFDWPYPENASEVLRKLLSAAEERHEKLSKLGTAGIFKAQRNNIRALGDRAGYDRWGATESQLLANWKLESAINFVDGFRLIYSQHPIYHLDLLLEFDSQWNPTCVLFDG